MRRIKVSSFLFSRLDNLLS
uniref:Uncharacterized protein n=1 Tax=Arundo donax TaxID=35708 RepID=A0A0A9H6A9_ARUDO